MKESDVLKMGVTLAAGILSSPVFASRTMNGPYEVQQTVRDCTNAIGMVAGEMGFEITKDAPE